MPTPTWIKRAGRSRAVAALLLCAAITILGGVVYRALAAAPPPPPTITSTPASPTASNAALFRFEERGAPKDSDNDHDTDAAAFRCSIDGGAYAACASPKSYGGLADGSHTFRVTAHQESTAASAPASYSWIVRTHPPTLTMTFPVGGGLYGAASWSAGCTAPGYCGSAADPAGVTQVQLSLQRQSTGQYWNGTAFSSGTQTFVAAALNHPGAQSTQWSYGFGISNFPSDGKYTVSVRAADSVGNQTAPAKAVTATFTIDTAAPPAPVLTRHPANPTTSTSATFGFRDIQQVTFACSVDYGAAAACSSPTTYTGLTAAAHHFAVVGCDRAGNCSAPTTFDWTVNPNSTPFGISGDAAGPFYPGDPSVPVDLVIANPFNSTLTVTSATVTVTGTSKAGCDASDFTVVQNLVGTVDIPANTTESLSAAGDPQTNWPAIQMIDKTSNQDACQNATVNLSYAGSGNHN